MTLSVQNVQIDVPGKAYDQAVDFWKGALSATPGHEAGSPFTHLKGAAAVLGVHLQRLADRASAGVHLDLRADDVEAQVARLVALGASPRWRWDAGEVLADPAGLVFCVTSEEWDDQLAPCSGDRGFVDAVVLDVPAGLHRATADFWAAALQVAPFARNSAGPPYLWSGPLQAPAGSFYLGVQRLADRDTPPRMHLDMIADDVDAEVARLRALGAAVTAALPRWTTLSDPTGHPFCVVGTAQGVP